jgi:hypothetical protein
MRENLHVRFGEGEVGRSLSPTSLLYRLGKPCAVNATTTEPRPSGSGFPKTVKHPRPPQVPWLRQRTGGVRRSIQVTPGAALPAGKV